MDVTFTLHGCMSCAFIGKAVEGTIYKGSIVMISTCDIIIGLCLVAGSFACIMVLGD